MRWALLISRMLGVCQPIGAKAPRRQGAKACFHWPPLLISRMLGVCQPIGASVTGPPCSLHGHSSWSFIAETFDASLSHVRCGHTAKSLCHSLSRFACVCEVKCMKKGCLFSLASAFDFTHATHAGVHSLFDQVSKGCVK